MCFLQDSLSSTGGGLLVQVHAVYSLADRALVPVHADGDNLGLAATTDADMDVEPN